MARAKFTGPEGTRFAGLDLRVITPPQGKLAHLALVQRATGLTRPALKAEMEQNESLALQVVTFLTLRNAGMFVSFEEAGETFADDDIEWVAEPGDLQSEGQDVDPTSAPTGSVRGDAAADVEADAPALRKTKKSGSKSRSATVS